MRDHTNRRSPDIRWNMLVAVTLLAGTASVFSSGVTTIDGSQTATNTADAKPGIATDFEELQLVGEARLKVLLWSVYDSRLYTGDGSYEEGQRPLRLEIQYLLDIKSDALVERTLEEWDAMGRRHPRQENWLEQLSNMWPDINKNDVLTLELAADNSASFRRNGELLGTIEDQDFGQQFIDIWLSTDCTRPSLRATLLGEPG